MSDEQTSVPHDDFDEETVSSNGTLTSDQIVEGYRLCPQTDDELAWSDTISIAMIAEEPW
jgi:hypothetical protein